MNEMVCTVWCGNFTGDPWLPGELPVVNPPYIENSMNQIILNTLNPLNLLLADSQAEASNMVAFKIKH